jgi:hypothetical protein
MYGLKPVPFKGRSLQNAIARLSYLPASIMFVIEAPSPSFVRHRLNLPLQDRFSKTAVASARAIFIKFDKIRSFLGYFEAMAMRATVSFCLRSSARPGKRVRFYGEGASGVWSRKERGA